MFIVLNVLVCRKCIPELRCFNSKLIKVDFPDPDSAEQKKTFKLFNIDFIQTLQ